ncbi:carboxymuconolactone decarboxylase family protein [Hydrogenophaga sp.]|uniref:carboxymuconolactone decarboxylase family protein n=1 Tax=Hydrogenophaga sp. TaxID=1904254 RepID=UPI002723DF41|nr:carboxymuconolactone decarboxylase family protein [Hydrogenophaga sp.]MDO9437177.1 carboxymuconolactone decarboxylase family protein [Hydrogenophaga sp.]
MSASHEAGSPPDRLPPLPPEQWTDEQRVRAEAIIRGPRGALISPFVPLMRSPELMDHAQAMGEYLRYRSALGMHLSEFAILLTARAWTQQVEWAIHAPIALKEGVSAETIDAIAHGRRPDNLTDDQAAVYAFVTELQHNQSVSDATWSAFLQRFGEREAMDLIGIVGYYSFLSMVMNVARTAVPPSVASRLPSL